MEKKTNIQFYSPTEEKLNIWSHAFGIFLSIIALVLLIIKAVQQDNIWMMISFPIFGVSLILLYLASTLYHASKEPQKRFKLKVFDHAAIYVLIAGSYTPFTLVSLNGETGWLIFSMVWVMAFTGIILKLFFTGRFKVISTTMYVLMGWLIVFYFQDLTAHLHEKGVFYLILGGVLYTIGAILYSIKKIKFNHAIFHFFVLAGSFCHFLSIYLYV
ncbi:PAQR family membrane homeostasis protein TrhA [Cloacibacterium caeni]|jgi:hemolysin III|uniref:PAQR family membrane homeostasis protein TrhA n=1 Tax=Cloacibacterium caeni TaxID=2004710 RepID=UPI001BCC0B35|nr:hemolysin III family protein [Cloacibacterium caeni]